MTEIALILVNVLFIVSAIPLFKVNVHHDIGPGVFPIIAGSAGVMCGIAGLLFMFLKGTWRLSPEDFIPAFELSVIKLALAMSAYIFIMGWLGFTVSTFLFAICAAWMFGSRKWPAIVAVALGIAAGSYLIFIKALAVSLPKGLIGF